MNGKWTLGPQVCELWITSDVFCCTASILNIVVIAVDRYLLITRNVRYTHSTILPRRTVCLLLTIAAWLTSALIASSPLLGWRTGTEREDPNVCVISQDYGYTIFSTFGAFWFPLIVIFIIYARIFRFARSRALRLQATKTCDTVVNMSCGGAAVGGGSYNETTTVMAVTSRHKFRTMSLRRCDSPSPSESTVAADLPSAQTIEPVNRPSVNSAASRMRKRRLQRMRRSARTLGLIIGGFVVCWLPFFVVATLAPFCQWCSVPPTVASVVLWLGYSNSLFNPAIYAIWDQSFRRSFKRLCLCQFRL
jgi:5-hydroxytryptamine receptor 1